MRHAGKPEAAIAVGIDRGASGIVGGADDDARHRSGHAFAGFDSVVVVPAPCGRMLK